MKIRLESLKLRIDVFLIADSSSYKSCSLSVSHSLSSDSEAFLSSLIRQYISQTLSNKSPALLPDYWPGNERIIVVVKTDRLINKISYNNL